MRISLKSAFRLLDATWLAEIIRMQGSETADLAFHSACQPGMGDKDLLQEAVHLDTGMLTASHRSVVATVWSIKDELGPKLVEALYSYLLDKG
jgi:CHAT domain-containing protein